MPPVAPLTCKSVMKSLDVDFPGYNTPNAQALLTQMNGLPVERLKKIWIGTCRETPGWLASQGQNKTLLHVLLRYKPIVVEQALTLMSQLPADIQKEIWTHRPKGVFGFEKTPLELLFETPSNINLCLKALDFFMHQPALALPVLDLAMLNQESAIRYKTQLRFYLAKQSDAVFEQYCETYFDKPWFIDGLGNNLKRLVVALERIKTKIKQNNLPIEPYHQMMCTFLGTEAAAKVIVPLLKSNKKLRACFYKQALMEALKSIQHESCPYRLQALQLIIGAEHHRLFRRQEMRYTSYAWYEDDLKALIPFALHPQVHNMPVGRAVQAELIVRCANFGVTDLFLDEQGKLRHDVAILELPRSAFLMCAEQPVDKKHQSAYNELLKQDVNACIDWQRVANTTFKALSHKGKVSAFTAFLWNYNGKTAPLKKMCEAYVLGVVQNPHDYDIKLLSRLISRTPEHPVSRVVYAVLLKELTTHWGILTMPVLGDLIRYRVKAEAFGVQDVKDFLTQLGQQKQYALLIRCCEIYTPLKREGAWFQRIKLEAQVELELLPDCKRWYFKLYAFFKRWWRCSGAYTVRMCHKKCVEIANSLPESIRNQLPGGEMVSAVMDAAKGHKQIVRFRCALEDGKWSAGLFRRKETAEGTRTFNVAVGHQPSAA